MPAALIAPRVEEEVVSFFVAVAVPVAFKARDPPVAAAASAPKRDEDVDGLVFPAAAFLRAERVSGPGEDSSPITIVVDAMSSTLLLLLPPLEAALDIESSLARSRVRLLLPLRTRTKGPKEREERERESARRFSTLNFLF